ncbi:conserved hypothetical protein [Clostridium neonatale]|uniref:DUF7922 domain-containing protein n=1 Tax=Clostridium neonatale TaxID=137838 RepID=A0AA86JN86_9CLOT|nr:conserved hypothetical protein [Clostridium neonatale]
MSHNKLYRNFIILQEDERGYSSENGKALSGYAKVEAKGDKCKISFYAQNLRKEDNYSMVLICCKRDFKELIDLGPLTINEVGKGDTSKEYYINNIAGLGVSYEKISGAGICKASGNDLNFIMHGFMNGEEPTENWRKFKLVRVESKKEDVVLEPKKLDEKIISANEKIVNSKVDDIGKAERIENIKIGTVEVLESVEKTDTNIESVEEKIEENILSSDERNKCKKCDKEEDKKEKHKKEECKKEEHKKDECKKKSVRRKSTKRMKNIKMNARNVRRAKQRKKSIKREL